MSPTRFRRRSAPRAPRAARRMSWPRSSCARRSCGPTPRRRRPTHRSRRRPRRAPTPQPRPPSPSASPAGTRVVDAVYDLDREARSVRSAASRRSRRSSPTLHRAAELRNLLTERLRHRQPARHTRRERASVQGARAHPRGRPICAARSSISSSERVGGFYRPNDQEPVRRLEGGKLGGNERFTFSHEYDHALQDQNFRSSSDQNGVLDQSDRIAGPAGGRTRATRPC